MIIRNANSGETLCKHSWLTTEENDEESCGEDPTCHYAIRACHQIISDPEHTAYAHAHSVPVKIPLKILDCDAISREIIFNSKKKMNNLSMTQRVMVERIIPNKEEVRSRTICLEEWFFVFGFVIPGSTNSWQSIITAAKGKKGDTRAMAGSHFMIDTHFYDDDSFVCKKSVKIKYI